MNELTDEEVGEIRTMRRALPPPTLYREQVKMLERQRIHSEKHLLAKDISEWCGEPKRFSKYLGVINRIGLPRAYTILSEMKQAKEIKNRGALFMYKAKGT